MEYKDFELMATDVQKIEEENTNRIAFKVQIPHSPAGEIIEGISCEYDVCELREHLANWEDGELEWEDIITLGYWLSTVLFPPNVRDLLVRSLDQVRIWGKGLRIRLLLGGALHNIPWEYVLVNRGGGEATSTDFLALMSDVSIVRHQAATLSPWEVRAELPARMIAALASPAGYGSLKLKTEQKAIEQALEENPHVEATFVPNATSDTLLSGVVQAHLFHFAGHGGFRKDKLSKEAGKYEGEGFLVLDNGRGDPAQLGASQLALKLRQAGVRVAVLGACRSGRRDDVNVWSSVATALLKAGLGAVVGMQYKILDKSAIAFASAFYKALAAGLPIDEAMTGGRLAVADTDVRGWGVPVLYLRSPNGVVFPEYAADAALEKTRETVRQWIQNLENITVSSSIGIAIGSNIEQNIKA